MVKYVVYDETDKKSPWLNGSREPVEVIRVDVLYPAAAEMLEALEEAKKVIDSVYGNINFQLALGLDGKPVPVQMKIDAAISKAKGKTEE